MTTAWTAQRRRRARWFLVALVVGVLAVTAVSFFLIVPTRPDDVLLARPVEGRDQSLEIQGVFRNLDAASATVSLNLSFQPAGELAGPSGPSTDLSVLVLGASTNSSLSFTEADPMRPVTVSVPLTGSRVTRYPFDKYRTRLVIAAGTADGEAIPVVLNLSANLNDFRASSRTSAESADTEGVDVTATFQRNGAVLIWAGTLGLLFWTLAAGAVMIGWIVIAHNQAVPIWSWAYLAGVLFALPNLRNGLPGTPPFGSLVDWGAFYWSVAVTGSVLFALLTTWFQRQRHAIAEATRAAEAAHANEPD